MSRPTDEAILDAALALAKTGQPVFPVHRKGKRAKAPHTVNGLYDATLSKKRIKQWWGSLYPGAGIGIPTGILWDVLDVDVKNEGVDGRLHLPYLHKLGLLDGCKKVTNTPSGGWHLYFRPDPDLKNKKSAALGLDVRAKGGYVLAPPSHIKTPNYKGAYTMIGETQSSSEDPLLWDLILSALQPTNKATPSDPIPLLPSERRASLAALREWLLRRVPGERNDSFHWAVCRCIDGGIDPHELVDAALELGLDPEEVHATIGSALRRANVRVEDLKTEAEALFPSY